MSKKSKALFCIIGGLLCLFILFFTVIIPKQNDSFALNTAKDIASLPLPENTQLIESKSIAGKLSGSGNGMQYFGAILIKSGLSLEELRQHYSAYAENNWTYCVENQPTSKIEQVEHEALSFETDIRESGYFIVFSWGSSRGIFSDFDIRGH